MPGVRHVKAWLIMHMLVGQPIVALVEEPVCTRLLEDLADGSTLQIIDANGGTGPTIVRAECLPHCDGGCS